MDIDSIGRRASIAASRRTPVPSARVRISEDAVKEYIAKKAFGTAYGNLYAKDKAVVDGALEDTILLPGPKRKPQTMSDVAAEKASAAAQTVKGWFNF